MRVIRHNLERVLCLPITEQDPTALVEKTSMKAPQVSGGAAASCMVESWRLPRSVTTLSFMDGHMGRGYITVRVGSLPEHKRSKLNRELNKFEFRTRRAQLGLSASARGIVMYDQASAHMSKSFLKVQQKFMEQYNIEAWHAGEQKIYWVLQKETETSRIPLPLWMSSIMELRVCKYITDLQAWQTKIEKRHAAGKALTKAQDKAYEAWKHSLVQRLVFCKKRQSLVTEARHINKDCIALDLRLSEDPNHLMVSSVNGDDYKLVLLKGGAVEGPCRALPSELDCPLSKQQVETMQAEEEENAVDSHGEQGEEQNLWDDEAGDHMIEDQRYEQECPQIDPNDFAVLADSDEELEDIEFPGGARADDVLRGVEAEVGRDALVETVAKHFSISKAQAELRYDDFPTTEAPNHQPLGSGCCHGIEEECNCPPAATFVIVCQGVWQSFAEQHGHGSEMQAMVEERRVVCWRDVLQLMYTPGLPEGKKLILRPRLFELVAGPQILSVVDEKEDVLDVVKIFGGEGPALMLRLSGRVMRVPCGSSRAYQVDVETIREAVKGLVVGTDEPELSYTGKLKVFLCIFECKLIPAPVVAAASAALLFASKGGFSPELQLFTRGATAAFKRLAVILLEDAWIEEDNMASSLEGLLALGLVTQQMNDYEPSHHLIISSMRIAAKAAMSCSLIAWRKGKQGPSSIKVSESSKSGKLEMLHAHGRPDIMPLCHIVDQHTFRGVGHVLGAGSGATFADRFHLLFDQCTGCNPRFSDLAGFESRPEVQRARFAQNCCLNFALQKPRNALPLISDGTPVSLELDTGVLAAGVGPISVHVNAGSKRKKELLVLLGLRCPEDEVVMLKPVRATRDLFGELTEKERADAVTLARSHSHRVVSPLLPSSKEAQFRDGMWEVDGCKWADLVSQGVKVKIPLVCPPRWCDDLLKNPSRVCDLLDDDGALEDALRSTGAGMIADSDKIDQLAAYDGDWKVYRLLALISRLVPAALRPTMPPNFQVVNSILLRVVEKWMMEGIQSRPADLHLPRSVGLETVGRWEEVQKCLEQVAELMEHQREAIHCMVQRDEDLKCGGHFLIMDTGHGKTVTALVYAFRWLCQHGQNVKRLVWITPHGTVENLVKQLRDTWRVKTHVVPRISSAKKPKSGERYDLVLKDFMVNVIHADHLRAAIDKGLAAEATSSFFVFDEVDEMYAPTLRTSAARRLCQLCPKFVAQTATPLRKNESQLLAWLADTCSFPVDKQNWLVAASGMVSMQLELGIAAREEDVLVPMVDDALAPAN
ncbi:Helicase ATP-binding domain-containing protein [Durusdinium trenchii]|uniref:Helicase ATP-binding domain-containing protein n=1 Tax=Durusdinium trenchii TaxID=1381693 RepID=A0ABP0SE07_9DINO